MAPPPAGFMLPSVPPSQHPPYLTRDDLPLLITGISGVAGFNALAYFAARYPGQVLGIRQRDNWRLAGPNIVPCDAEDEASLAQLFDEHQFRTVLDCAGNCALKSCELDPVMARRINVEGVETLLRTIADRPVRLVHLSIDLVYSGERPGGYVETDPTDPVTVYGQTMVEAENLLLAQRPSTAILRISLPMGVSFNGHAGAIDWIQSRFKQGKPATLYFDEVRTPTYTDCLNVLFDEVLARDELQGLYHAGGPRRLTLYEIAQIVNRVGGYDPRHVQGCPRLEAGPMPPRAGNVSMDSSRLIAALGHNPLDAWPIDPELAPTHPEWHFDRDNSWRGSPGMLSEVLYKNPRRRKQVA